MSNNDTRKKNSKKIVLGNNAYASNLFTGYSIFYEFSLDFNEISVYLLDSYSSSITNMNVRTANWLFFE